MEDAVRRFNGGGVRALDKPPALLAKWPMATMVLVTEVPMLAPITLLQGRAS